MDDEQLLKKAEEALAEIDRNSGLADEPASVLAALRIRLFGAPKQTLDEVFKAAGDLRGKHSLEDLKPPQAAGSLDQALNRPEKRKEWPV